jgi:hypothetical protein
LATLTGGRAIHFDDWEAEFRDLDILVSSTAAPHPIITLDKLATFGRARWHRPLFMIDLAMPRDIDPAVQELDGIYLYDLDSLRSIAERTLAFRKQESERCHQLIERHVQEFQSWMERTQQRVGVARAIVTDPTLLLCDEPTGDLDRKSGDEVLNLLEHLRSEQGKTIIMVTHDSQASARASRTVHLNKGRLIPDQPD